MILACDPGISGAFCLYDPQSGRMDLAVMPVVKIEVSGKRALRKAIDERGVLDVVREFADEGAKHLFIERVNGIQGQSASAAFNFGAGYAGVRMAALALGLEVSSVPPATWKAAMRVPADKNAARERASEMIPTHREEFARVCDDGKAEAALLALYAFRVLNGDRFTKRTPSEQRSIERAAQARKDAAARRRSMLDANRARFVAIGQSDNPDLAKRLF